MTTSRRRLGYTAKRRIDVAELEVLEQAYINHHIVRSSSPKTVEHYRNTFIAFHLFLDDRHYSHDSKALTSDVIAEFAVWLKDRPTRIRRGKTERSIVTIHGLIKDLRAFVRWLHENDRLETLPKIYLPKLPQTLFPILSDEDLIKIFSTEQMSQTTEIGKRNHAVIAFMLDTGVRLGEVAALKLDDIHLEDGLAKVWGKGSRERMVFFSPITADAIKLWLNVRGREPGQLFWLNPAGIRMMIDRIQKEAGLEVFHAHQIRHTALTIMLRNDMDSHKVKRIAGHSSILVTERYLSLSHQDLQDAHRTASPVEAVVRQLEPERGTKRRWNHRKAS
jgi:site-specific recombinase XerD